MLQSHAKIHTQEFSFTCNRCDKTFRHKNSLVLHERVHTGGKPYKCNTCNNTFSQSTHLLTHKRSVHSALTEECKVCRKKFQSSEYARKHEVSMHSNTKDFQCEKCMKMFKLSSHLKAHKAVHEKKSVCLQHVSKDLFKTLQKHIEEIHQNIKKIYCIHCDEKFSRKEYVTCHTKKAHNGEYVQNTENYLRCVHCPKTFPQESSLKAHLRGLVQNKNGIFFDIVRK